MADLCTPAELASFLQVPSVDTFSAQQVCAGASAAVRRYTRRYFSAGTWTGVRLPVRRDREAGYVIDLPQRPVDTVTSVVVNGAAVGNYEIDHVRNRIVLSCFLPAAAVGVTDQAVVSYTTTAASDIDDVKLICLAIAARAYSNPQSVRSQTLTIDDYTETTNRGGDGSGAGASSVVLLDSEMVALDDFRIGRTGTARLR